MKTFKTFISAGHHNADSGAVANGYKEAELTKEARNLIASYSNIQNIILDEDWETNKQYQNRIKPESTSVVFDIHFNAGGPSATGTECYVNQKDFSNKNSLSYKMASEICDLASQTLKIRNRGVKPENYSQHSRIGILNLGARISVLWEVCFITSILDMQSYSQNKNKLLIKVAEIIEKYGIHKK